MLKRKFNEWKQKRLSTKISDIVFIVLVVAILIPSSRMKVMGFINHVKAKIIQPSLKKESKIQKMSDKDFDWDLVSLQKGRTNLNQYKDKVIFLNLWATWCPPCVGELPEIQKLYNKFKFDDDIVFILVSNEEPDVIENFLAKNNYNLPAYISLEQSPGILQSRTIPTSYVISKEGKIVIKEKGAVNWGGSKMENIIKTLLQK